jgi:hypothetical protein
VNGKNQSSAVPQRRDEVGCGVEDIDVLAQKIERQHEVLPKAASPPEAPPVGHETVSNVPPHRAGGEEVVTVEKEFFVRGKLGQGRGQTGTIVPDSRRSMGILPNVDGNPHGLRSPSP